MDSEIWGPKGWFFLHTITFNYPDNPTPNEKAQYYNFFMNLQYVLPCEICKKNYPKHLKDYPLDDNALKNKRTLSKWLVKIHNHANIELGKPTMSYKDVLAKYNAIYEKKTNILYYVVILVVLCFVSKYIIKR